MFQTLIKFFLLIEQICAWDVFQGTWEMLLPKLSFAGATQLRKHDGFVPVWMAQWQGIKIHRGHRDSLIHTDPLLSTISPGKYVLENLWKVSLSKRQYGTVVKSGWRGQPALVFLFRLEWVCCYLNLLVYKMPFSLCWKGSEHCTRMSTCHKYWTMKPLCVVSSISISKASLSLQNLFAHTANCLPDKVNSSRTRAAAKGFFQGSTQGFHWYRDRPFPVSIFCAYLRERNPVVLVWSLHAESLH